MPRRILRTIPEPARDTRVILRQEDGVLERLLPELLAARIGGEAGPFFTGDGPVDLLCGECGRTLARGMEEGRISDVVFECPDCGAYNDTG